MHIKFALLPVQDQGRAKDFYIQTFGCDVAVDKPYKDDGWRWIELKFPDAETTLRFERREDDSPSAEPSLVLVDADLDATVALLKSHGVTVITEPKETPWEPAGRVKRPRPPEKRSARPKTQT